MIEAQKNDHLLQQVIQLKKHNQAPTSATWKRASKEMRPFLRELKQMKINSHGILFRETVNHTQVVLPSKYRAWAIQEIHGKMGHLGADRVLELARQRFYWPHMKQEVEDHINHKCSCVMQRKPAHPPKAPMIPIITTDTTRADFQRLPSSRD